MEAIIAVGIILVVLLLIFFSGCLKAPPDTAYIIYGLRKRRILIGQSSSWRIHDFCISL